MQKYHICHVCGGEMYPQIESEEYHFNGNQITVDDMRVFRCMNCGEGILEAEEVERIQNILIAKYNNNN